MRLAKVLSLSLVITILCLGFQPMETVHAQSTVFVRVGGSDADCNGTVNVDHSAGVEPNCAFATIQHAVDTVNPGGTVHVASGTYNENNIRITQSVTLIGDPGDTSEPGGEGPGPDAPVVDGGGAANVPMVDILADDVTIQGFQIQHVHDPDPGVAVGIRGGIGVVGDNVTLLDNRITDTQWAGIMYWTNGGTPANNWTIRRNIVEHGPWSSNTNVYGIELTNVAQSDISYNIVSGGYMGIMVTAQAWNSDAVTEYVTVTNNQLLGGFASIQNTLYASGYSGNEGILRNITVTGNTFAGNTGGAYAWTYVQGGGTASINNLNISDNTFDLASPADSIRMVYMLNVGGINSITGNTFTFSGTPAASWAHGVDISGSATGDFTIMDNVFDGAAAGESGVGIRLRDDLPGTASVNITANAIENFSASSGRGIRTSSLAPQLDITVYDNCFDNNTYALVHDAQWLLDATENYWGDPTGPYHPTLNPSGNGDPVSDSVTFVPFFNTCNLFQPTPTPTATTTQTPTPTEPTEVPPTSTHTPTPTSTSEAPSDPGLPETGFAPHEITNPGPQSVAYFDLLGPNGGSGMFLSIPRIEVSSLILGVPQSAEGWNVRWLGNYVGWLSGSAFPTWEGNTVLTGHIYNSNGKPGIFVNLNQLSWGDQVVIAAWGQEHVYEVRSVEYVRADDVDAVMQHETQDWLTLLTCYGFDEETGTFDLRIVVRAIRIE
jgi:LPXTG-site transpeptidase (sortase) family protein